MTEYFKESVLYLHSLGVFTHVLPFILIYVILYGVLEKIKIFGKENYSNYNSIFSFSLAFFTIYNFNITEGLPFLIVRVGLLFIILIAIRLITGLMGMDDIYENSYIKFAGIILLSIYLAYSIIDAFFDFNKIVSWLQKNNLFGVIGSIGLALVVFVGIIWFVTSSPKIKEESKKTFSKPKKEAKKKQENINSDALDEILNKRINPTSLYEGENLIDPEFQNRNFEF